MRGAGSAALAAGGSQVLPNPFRRGGVAVESFVKALRTDGALEIEPDLLDTALGTRVTLEPVPAHLVHAGSPKSGRQILGAPSTRSSAFVEEWSDGTVEQQDFAGAYLVLSGAAVLVYFGGDGVEFRIDEGVEMSSGTAAEAASHTDQSTPTASLAAPILTGRQPQGPRNRLRRSAPFLFLGPWIIGMLGITLGPMIASLVLSFTDYNFLGQFDWVGIENYTRMFTSDPRYLTSLVVTFTYVFVSVPIQLAFALGIAMVLNQGLRGLAFYRSVYYLPSLLGTSVAIAILWRQVFGADGLVNQVLGAFGFDDAPNWIATPEFALGTLITLNVWTFGSPMIIFLAGLRQVPHELNEAAAVDGAGRWTRFARITIPMISPVIFFNLVLQMISAFQTFTQAYIVSGGSGGPVDSTLFYTLYLYEKAFRDFDMGYASAMAWVLLLVIALFTWLAFASANRWVHYGEE